MIEDLPDDVARRRRRMPLKSKAQRRKFAQLLVEGKITPETFEEWNRETGSKELPERVRPKKKAAKKRARKRKPSA
jgi:hypothetical protein